MGLAKNIKTPELLYKHFEDYKKVCKENPKKESIWNSRESKQATLDREVPLTWDGFEVYLFKKKILSRLDDYKSNREERYSNFVYIIRAIGLEIYEDKFNGATAGVFQHNIIARDLGLTDKKDLSSSDGSMTPQPTIIVKEELKDQLDKL